MNKLLFASSTRFLGKPVRELQRSHTHSPTVPAASRGPTAASPRTAKAGITVTSRSVLSAHSSLTGEALYYSISISNEISKYSQTPLFKFWKSIKYSK